MKSAMKSFSKYQNILLVYSFCAIIFGVSQTSQVRKSGVIIDKSEHDRFFWHKHHHHESPAEIKWERSNDLSPIGGKCYFISSNIANVDGATKSCLNNNMRLASLPTKAENDIVFKYLTDLNVFSDSKTRIWTSGHRDPCDNLSWIWQGIDVPVTYTQWAKGEPNSAARKEDCVELYLQNKDTMVWNDSTCDKLRRYLCEGSCSRPK